MARLSGGDSNTQKFRRPCRQRASRPARPGRRNQPVTPPTSKRHCRPSLVGHPAAILREPASFGHDVMRPDRVCCHLPTSVFCLRPRLPSCQSAGARGNAVPRTANSVWRLHLASDQAGLGTLLNRQPPVDPPVENGPSAFRRTSQRDDRHATCLGLAFFAAHAATRKHDMALPQRVRTGGGGELYPRCRLTLALVTRTAKSGTMG